MLTALGNHLWQSTLVAGLIGLLVFALRRHGAHVRHALWLAASLKFLVPFAWLAGLGSLLWSSVAVVPVATNLSEKAEGIVRVIAAPFTINSSAPGSTMDVASVVLVLWAAGAMLISVRWSQRWMQLRRRVREAAPLSREFPIPIRSSAMLFEPGIVGVLRPMLLLPNGIEERLEPEQLRAILAHELCHVRRRDNLTATLHMFVELMFWFHPLVWWIGARLIAERELACDEAVVRAGNDRRVYAEAILRVCKGYLESRSPCVAGVGGTNLARRIEMIMNANLAARMSTLVKLGLGAAALFTMVFPLALGAAGYSKTRPQNAVQPDVVNDAQRMSKEPETVAVSMRILENGKLVSTPTITTRFGQTGQVGSGYEARGMSVLFISMPLEDGEVEISARLDVEPWPGGKVPSYELSADGAVVRARYGEEVEFPVDQNKTPGFRLFLTPWKTKNCQGSECWHEPGDTDAPR